MENTELSFDNVKINEIKEDLNLMMFNSKRFSVNDMEVVNQVSEVLKNVKIKINSN